MTISNRRHPTERVTVGDWDEQIDVEIAPLVRSIWEAGIETVMSCQDTFDGLTWIEFATLEGFERFLNAIHQTASKDSPLLERITWDSDDCDSWWTYELVPCLYCPGEQEGAQSTPRQPGGMSLDLSLRFPRTDLPEVTRLMALFNLQHGARRPY